MKKILIVSGHPHLSGSIVNQSILDDLRKEFPEAELDVLDQAYPDYRIDVKAEQEKVMAADIIVWQFPVFWYSMPSLLRRWIEEVLLHGFAYGSTGHATAGKKLIASFTSGAPAAAYSKEGVGFTIEQLMDPQIKATAALCQMDIQPYVYTGGVNSALRETPEQLDALRQQARQHAERLIQAIKALA